MLLMSSRNSSTTIWQKAYGKIKVSGQITSLCVLYLCVSEEEHSVITSLPCHVIQLLQVLMEGFIVISSSQLNLHNESIKKKKKQQKSKNRCKHNPFDTYSCTCMMNRAHRVQ